MFVRGLTLSCWGCLQGHRAQTCTHENRPLYALKRKGRPHKDDHLLPVEQDTPHFENLANTQAFEAFLYRIFADPALKDWYYREEEPVKSPGSPKKPCKKKPEEKKHADPNEMYGGRITYDEFQRWKQLCGLEDLPDNAMVTKEFLMERVSQHFAAFAPQLASRNQNHQNPQEMDWEEMDMLTGMYCGSAWDDGHQGL